VTNKNDRKTLLAAARKTIEISLNGKRPYWRDVLPSGTDIPEGKGGAFVTLKKHGDLRGCIGRLQSEEPIAKTVSEMAYAAAFEDPRFPPLVSGELNDILIEISRLSGFFPIKAEEVEVGKHGLMLRVGYLSGLLLPQVPIEQGWSKSEYLAGLCRKAGLPVGSWDHPDAEFLAFTAEVFSENEM